MGIIHGQSFILIGITTNLKHSYTSLHYNVLAGAFFVGRLFPPQVNTSAVCKPDLAIFTLSIRRGYCLIQVNQSTEQPKISDKDQ